MDLLIKPIKGREKVAMKRAENCVWKHLRSQSSEFKRDLENVCIWKVAIEKGQGRKVVLWEG